MTLQTFQTLIPPGFIDLGAGDPQLELLPLQLLRTAAQERLGQNDHAFLQYGAEQGDGYFRDALANFLTPRYGFPVSHDGLFVTTGISAALDLLCTLYTKPGDTILVEEPTYFLALRIFADHDLNVVSIRTDEAGLDMDALSDALKTHRPKFFYIIPTFQNPSGHTLPPERREQIVSLAQKHDFLIFADEVYQFLCYTQAPPKPFGAYIDSEHVIALSSFSKILAPGLRLGWMHTHPAIMHRLNTCGLLDSGGGMNPFTSAILRTVIESGGLEKNIAKLVKVFSKRVKTMAESLRRHVPQAQFTTPHGGYFFWLRLPNNDTQEIQKKAQAHQMGLRPGIRFSSRNGLRDYMRLSISFYEDEQISEGILRLKNCMEGN
ncbi:MAG: PLP-dependent aminotransferase family protein [Anaerolineales bacterium]|nr:MAG: PLP-dependent aminotransferase family protein [Anaerolineales bacterium]